MSCDSLVLPEFLKLSVLSRFHLKRLPLRTCKRCHEVKAIKHYKRLSRTKNKYSPLCNQCVLLSRSRRKFKSNYKKYIVPIVGQFVKALKTI